MPDAPVRRTRPAALFVGVTPDERKRVAEQARDRGMTVTDHVRDRLGLPSAAETDGRRNRRVTE